MFGFGKKKALVSHEQIQSLFVDDQLEIARARAKLFARVSHYTALHDGENYDVDTKAAYFEGLMDGELVSFGPLQIVGTYHDGTFMWSWHNPSIPEQSWSDVKSFVEELEGLTSLAAQKKFDCDLEFAEQLCQWIAVKSGWLGAFEAPNAEAIAFLLLKLTCVANHSVEPNDNMWCSFCGRLDTQAAKILKAAPSCAICNLCVVDYHHIAGDTAPGESEMQGEGTPQFHDIATMPPCLICGARTKRIFSTHGSVCYECIEACNDAIS